MECRCVTGKIESKVIWTMETDREDGCLMEEESYGGGIGVCRHFDKELDSGM